LKSIFITGGASGIGLATARHFSRQGWTVGIGDIDEIAMRRASEELRAYAAPLDVRDRLQWQAALGGFVGMTGRLDVLLNNAGVARYGLFEEVSPEEADLQVDVNVKGVINGAYAGLEHLKATPGSRLINVASCAALHGSAGLSVYAATKAAVRGLSQALDIEFGRHGIAVACVMPWFVETPILDSGATGTNRTIRDAIADYPVYTAEEAAAVVWQAAHGDEVDYIVGKAGRRVRTALRWMPGRVRQRMKAAMGG
jgi:NAD(P)-dependent dehydrogenase (short-subunit alcohol dehydrogenase family)